VKSIGTSSFSGCTGLEEIITPDSVTSIGKNAFNGCSGVEKRVLSKNIIVIGESAFSGCSYLKKIRVPSTVKSIYTNSFPSTTIWLVDENSPSHIYSQANDVLYFVIRKTLNPEIAYGKGIIGTVGYIGEGAASDVTVELLYDDGIIKESVTTDAKGLEKVEIYDVPAGTKENICTLDENQIAFVWNENLKPLCEKFSINK